MTHLFEQKLIEAGIDFKVNYNSTFGSKYYTVKLNGKAIDVRVADHESKKDLSDIDIDFVYEEPDLKWLSDGIEDDEEECERFYYEKLVNELFDKLNRF